MKLPQLSLRDLFWLVLVCGMAVGWSLTAVALRGLKNNQVEAYMEGHMDGEGRVSSWWAKKVDSTADPNARALLSKYWDEQPRGGSIDVPDVYWP